MARPSLRARALAALARREYSRSELARKLSPYVRENGELEAVLDALEKDKLLSAARFAESLVHRRAARYGNLRIGLELKQHQLDPDVIDARLEVLAASELERCRSVWAKKFDHLPADFLEHSRQARFLAGRGFTAATIEQVLSGGLEPD